MGERTIELSSIPPIEFYGVNDKKLKQLAKHFPKLKLIGRGQSLKVIGDNGSVDHFLERFLLIRSYYERYGNLPFAEMERIALSGEANRQGGAKDDVLVYGPSGKLIRARTANQRKVVKAVEENDMTFVIGPAGSGKTYTAVALAVRALKNKEVKRIILTRPAVEAGESIGFLPGDMKDKLDPYLQPLYDALMDMLPPAKLQGYMETGVIQIAPLGFMRGRTLDHAFVILDEAQNSTQAQMKMFLTRMGNSAKFVITGDTTQIDLPKSGKSGLIESWNLLKGIEGISFVKLGVVDIVRHGIVKKIVAAYDKLEKK